MTTHDAWDELAAGHALHALEPDEELRFNEHLATCDECTKVLREHELVAAQLGALAYADDDEDVSVPEWSTIRTAVVGKSVPTSLDARRQAKRRQPRILAAAAAAVVIAAAGLAVWQTRGTSTSPAERALQSCRHQAGCTVVRLHASRGADPAVVLVSADRVTMVPLAMKPPAQGKQYVLWQLLRSGAPTPVAEITDASDPTSAGLVMSYADTAAFAVSVESASVPPSQPTQVVAIGNTTA
jgi:anti-sigma-K factor RskA